MIIPSWNPGLSLIETDRSGGMLMRALERARAQEEARTGLHCSTIVNDIAKTLDPKRYAKEQTADSARSSLLFMELGTLHETVMARELQTRHGTAWVKPEPRCYHGVWCSPDGWHAPSKTIDEIKLTWVSERDFEESSKLRIYTYQSLEYALAWGAERIRLHVGFVCGGYPGGSPVPTSRTFILRWQHGVREANDRMLRQHAKDRGWL